jgi:hypothetical protein
MSTDITTVGAFALVEADGLHRMLRSLPYSVLRLDVGVQPVQVVPSRDAKATVGTLQYLSRAHSNTLTSCQASCTTTTPSALHCNTG